MTLMKKLDEVRASLNGELSPEEQHALWALVFAILEKDWDMEYAASNGKAINPEVFAQICMEMTATSGRFANREHWRLAMIRAGMFMGPDYITDMRTAFALMAKVDQF